MAISAMSTTRKPNARRPTVSRAHQKILGAAFELFASLGFDATKMEMIADDAGVSRQTLHRYYPSKEELYQAILAIEGDALDEKFSAINMTADPVHVLNELISVTFDELVGNAKFSILDVKLHKGIKVPSTVVKTGELHRVALENTFARGKAIGIFSDGADAALFQATMIILFNGYACSSDILQTLTGLESKSPGSVLRWKRHLTDLLLGSIAKSA